MNQPDIAILDQTTADGRLAAWALRQQWPHLTIADSPPVADPDHKLTVLLFVPQPLTPKGEEAIRALAAESRWLFVCANGNEAFLRSLREAEGDDRPDVNYVHNIERSQCVFAWYYANGEGRRVPRLLLAAQDHALDEYRLDDTKGLIAAFNSYGWDDDSLVTSIIQRAEDPARLPTMRAEGEAILRYLTKYPPGVAP